MPPRVYAIYPTQQCCLFHTFRTGKSLYLYTLGGRYQSTVGSPTSDALSLSLSFAFLLTPYLAQRWIFNFPSFSLFLPSRARATHKPPEVMRAVYIAFLGTFHSLYIRIYIYRTGLFHEFHHKSTPERKREIYK